MIVQALYDVIKRFAVELQKGGEMYKTAAGKLIKVIGVGGAGVDAFLIEGDNLVKCLTIRGGV